jgi:ribose transport system permease protein
MTKLAGIIGFAILLYAALLFANEGARSFQNHYLLLERIGLYGILSLAAGMLIITGGIDLSIGSVVGFTATAFVIFVIDWGWSPAAAIPAVLAVGSVIGLINGLLVTKVRVQPFVVTLCGLFIYRGAARWFAGDRVWGLGTQHQELKDFFNKGDLLNLPTYFWIFVVLLAAATVFMHLSVYGRYYFAIGSNERAARYSGIATDFYKITAYVMCSTLVAFFAFLYVMKSNSVQPSSTGSFMELYAIAGAVLGGCSLRGGEGTVLGILLGSGIIWILPNLTNMWGIPSALEDAVIGGALLFGAIMDELLRRRALSRGA